jgi:hypothetical protein
MGKCTHNVTYRRVHVATVAVEKQSVFNILSVCLYSCLSYLPCKANVLHYIAICGLSGSTIFSHIIPLTAPFLENNFLDMICVSYITQKSN